ncbi:MAG: branched-chain amino acid ABC transporter permease, partial [Treponema sp.]|nr:branched-chain amino acid ABC transporter permease [Treponema sp.]
MKELNPNKNRTTLILILCLFFLSIVLEQAISPTSPAAMLLTVLKKSCVYAVVAVSMNLLNGFTGLFSLGQAGFMLLGAYTYAILTIPIEYKPLVYRYYDPAITFSLPEVLGSAMGGFGMVLGVLIAIILAGLVATGVAYLISLPVLRLKSDYLAIATLGFAEIIRAVFQWTKLGPVTNGANPLKDYVRLIAFRLNFGSVTISLSVFFLL